VNNNDKTRESLATATDDALFREAGDRLRKLFFREYGVPFQFGCFELVFHKGALQWIEERPRYRRYVGKQPRNFAVLPGTDHAKTS